MDVTCRCFHCKLQSHRSFHSSISSIGKVISFTLILLYQQAISYPFTAFPFTLEISRSPPPFTALMTVQIPDRTIIVTSSFLPPSIATSSPFHMHPVESFHQAGHDRSNSTVRLFHDATLAVAPQTFLGDFYDYCFYNFVSPFYIVLYVVCLFLHKLNSLFYLILS